MKKNNDVPKVHKVDLQHFLEESLVVDPYWDDLYNPKETNTKHKKRNNENI